MIPPNADAKRQLPAGWRWAHLGDVCDLVNGDAFKESDWSTTGVPIIRIQNLNDPSKPYNYWSGHLKDRVIVKTGDVLLAWSGTPGTSFGAHFWTGGPAVLNQHIFRVDLSEAHAIADWLILAINYRLDILIRKAHGAVGLRHVTRTEVENLQLPLPPLREQERIATLLKAQLRAVDAAQASADAQLKAAKVLPAAYLRAIFNSPEAQSWPRRPLGEMGEIVSGVTLGRDLDGEKTRPVPYLRVANVKDAYLDLSDVYETEATAVEIQKYQLRYGDVLLTEGGDPDKLGRGTFWQEQIPHCIHQNHIFRVRFNLGNFSPQFVSAQLGSPYGKSYFLAHAKRTTGIATINRKVLAAFPLMVLSLPEQQRIVSTLTEKLAEVEKTTKSLKDQRAAINALPAALLRRAFSGEL